MAKYDLLDNIDTFALTFRESHQEEFIARFVAMPTSVKLGYLRMWLSNFSGASIDGDEVTVDTTEIQRWRESETKVKGLLEKLGKALVMVEMQEAV